MLILCRGVWPQSHPTYKVNCIWVLKREISELFESYHTIERCVHPITALLAKEQRLAVHSTTVFDDFQNIFAHHHLFDPALDAKDVEKETPF